MEREEVLSKLEACEIPKLPEVITEIFNLLQNPIGIDTVLLVEKIRNYGNLEELLLKKVNLSFFAQGKQIDALQQAILYFGIQTIQNLLVYFLIRSLFSSYRVQKGGYNGALYWRHCLGTSIAAKMLAERTGKCDPYIMFSYGLIHDIGIAILEFTLPESLAEIRQVQQNHVTQIIAERKVLGGLTHEDIGIWLCKRWRLPIRILNIAGFHHRPFLVSENKEEAKLFHIADVISTIYYVGLIGVNNTIEVNKNLLSSLSVESNLIKEIRNKLPEEVEKVNNIFV